MNRTSLAIAALLLIGFSLQSSLCAKVRLYHVVSGSMAPSMPVGSLILVSDGRKSLLKPGEIATFRKDGLVITHRILDLGYDGSFFYVTKGDANKLPDPEPVRHQQILGRVILIIPPTAAPLLQIIRNVGLWLLPALLLLLLPQKTHRKNTRFFRPTQ